MILLSTVSGCVGSATSSGRAVADERWAQVAATESARPEWIDRAREPESGQLAFVGSSHLHTAEKDARDQAYHDAIRRFAEFCGVRVMTSYESVRSSRTDRDDIVVSGVDITDSQRQIVEAFVSRVRPERWYVETLEKGKSGKRAYRAWVLSRVPEEEFARVRAEAERRRQEREERRLRSVAIVVKGDRDGRVEAALSAAIVKMAITVVDSGPEALPERGAIVSAELETRVLGKDPYGIFIIAEGTLSVKVFDPRSGTVIHRDLVTLKKPAATAESAVTVCVQALVDRVLPGVVSGLKDHGE